MHVEELRSMQAPLKERYRQTPEAALITLNAEGRLGEGVSCKVETGKAAVVAGLHPATGGTGLNACSGDMLLEALVACAGVTLNAVATALGIALRDATVRVVTMSIIWLSAGKSSTAHGEVAPSQPATASRQMSRCNSTERSSERYA